MLKRELTVTLAVNLTNSALSLGVAVIIARVLGREGQALYALAIFLPSITSTLCRMGQETVNGVPSRHYRNTESSFLGSAVAGCTFASFEDDIWVAVEGDFPVKRELNAEADCQGESGSFNLYMEIRDVNQPQGINPPV